MRCGLSLSGGGSRIDVLLAAALYVTKKGYKPDWYAGVSSGLLTALAIEFGVADKILSAVMDDKINWIKHKPITNEGKMTWWAIWSILRGRNYLGEQCEDVIIRQFISEGAWQVYRESRNRRPIYGLIVCMEDGERWMHDIGLLGYEDMVQFVSASCRVPFWTKPVEINGLHWADGGWRDHNPSTVVMAGKELETSHLVSLSTRPIVKKGYPTGLLGVLSKIISIYSEETTYADEQLERLYCKNKGIDRYFLRLPDCKNHPYDTDKERSRRSVDMTMEAIKNYSP